MSTNEKPQEAQQAIPVPCELGLDELQAVAGGLVVQNTRPLPTVYSVNGVGSR